MNTLVESCITNIMTLLEPVQRGDFKKYLLCCIIYKYDEIYALAHDTNRYITSIVQTDYNPDNAIRILKCIDNDIYFTKFKIIIQLICENPGIIFDDAEIHTISEDKSLKLRNLISDRMLMTRTQAIQFFEMIIGG